MINEHFEKQFFYVFYLISIYKSRQTCNNNNSKFTRKNQRQKSTKKYLLIKTKALIITGKTFTPVTIKHTFFLSPSFFIITSSVSKSHLTWSLFWILPYNVKKTCITENKTYSFQKSNFLSYQEDLHSLNHWRNW
jgi:hypothetical protein